MTDIFAAREKDPGDIKTEMLIEGATMSITTAEKLANSAHVAWATGGALVPEHIREAYKTMYL